MRREVKYKIKGMTKDYSNSAFSPEFSFDNRNIRITTLEGNTTLSIVNEKGTKDIEVMVNSDPDERITGTCIGHVVNNNILILFTAGLRDPNGNLMEGERDCIWEASLHSSRDLLYVDFLYEGNLNFSIDNPIEAISIYENENNIKVYWVDGKNQPRMLNIKDPNLPCDTLPSSYFDFVPTLRSESSIQVDKQYSSGSFPAGVIQYCFTCFNYNGQESNIINVSPLYYTTNEDMGGNKDSVVSNSYKLSIINLDTRAFKYIRIYSILRTSIDATPLCKVVADLEITDSEVSIIDTGTIGYTIDPTDLLYVGGEVIVAGTLNHKDNTLFLGNIKVNKLDAGSLKVPAFQDKTIAELLRYGQGVERDITFEYSNFGDFGKENVIRINDKTSTGDYPYKNQLDEPSSCVKVFKYGETYRFGVQFLHNSGKWSSPVWIGDIENNMPPKGEYNTTDAISVNVAKPTYTIGNKDIINTLEDNGYIAARPVVVYPTDNDRSCICQGVINPTVFNVRDRSNKSTFAQASWFFRPKLPYATTDLNFGDFNDDREISLNSKGGIVATEDTYTFSGDGDVGPYYVVLRPKDAWTEFRHHYFIPHNRDTRAEIQCIEQYPNSVVKKIYTEEGKNYDNYQVTEVPYIEGGNNYEHFPEMYAIDSYLVTLNSPEVEFGKIHPNILNGAKLRYTGIIPITGNMQEADVMSSTAPITNNSGVTATGFMHEFVNQVPNLDVRAGRRKLASTLWRDFVDESSSTEMHFITYPWHRTGSLNMTRTPTNEGYRSAMLQNQKRSTLFFSTNSIYLNYTNRRVYSPNKPVLFNNENMKYVPYSIQGGYTDVIYRGDVSTVVIPEMTSENVEGAKVGDLIRDKKRGYYIVKGTMEGDYSRGRSTNLNIKYYGKDPVSIQYKSTPHIVLDHGYLLNSRMSRYIIPALAGINNDSAYEKETFYGSNYDYANTVYANSEITEASGGDYTSTPGYSWLWMAELYREVPEEVRFGGKSKLALENNTWVVAGDSVPLSCVELQWTEGDHFYQRYDCLKTYPYTLDDTNSVVEILSFMCETRVNLDGRYDVNRGKRDNLVMTPNNFNLMNPVYDQTNNFFTYRINEKQYTEIDEYINQVTWSKTKTFGEKIDTWTNITLASILDFDGDKGRIEAIKKLNNDLIVFQEKGISQIMYNDNVQISTQSGVPIEIANSGKVQGKRYLSSSVGCNNKWSICESPAGLYFIDDITKGIYLFNGSLTNLTTKYGFSSWAKDTLHGLNKFIFSPYNNNFLSHYDPVEGEVLFMGREETLVFSEKLDAFTSFYDYKNKYIPVMLGDRTLLVGGDGKVEFYGYHEGGYNEFYGEPKSYHVELIVGPEPTKDKIFNTIEYRGDVFIADTYTDYANPFSSIQVWNEYQDTNKVFLDNSNTRKKFRIWRHTIQRDRNGRDRIRNPWVNIKLVSEELESCKSIIHDITVSYFD
jgi:hypothetical protein